MEKHKPKIEIFHNLFTKEQIQFLQEALIVINYFTSSFKPKIINPGLSLKDLMKNSYSTSFAPNIDDKTQDNYLSQLSTLHQKIKLDIGIGVRETTADPYTRTLMILELMVRYLKLEDASYTRNITTAELVNEIKIIQTTLSSIEHILPELDYSMVLYSAYDHKPDYPTIQFRNYSKLYSNVPKQLLSQCYKILDSSRNLMNDLVRHIGLSEVEPNMEETRKVEVGEMLEKNFNHIDPAVIALVVLYNPDLFEYFKYRIMDKAMSIENSASSEIILDSYIAQVRILSIEAKTNFVSSVKTIVDRLSRQKTPVIYKYFVISEAISCHEHTLHKTDDPMKITNLESDIQQLKEITSEFYKDNNKFAKEFEFLMAGVMQIVEKMKNTDLAYKILNLISLSHPNLSILKKDILINNDKHTIYTSIKYTAYDSLQALASLPNKRSVLIQTYSMLKPKSSSRLNTYLFQLFLLKHSDKAVDQNVILKFEEEELIPIYSQYQLENRMNMIVNTRDNYENRHIFSQSIDKFKDLLISCIHAYHNISDDNMPEFRLENIDLVFEDNKNIIENSELEEYIGKRLFSTVLFYYMNFIMNFNLFVDMVNDNVINKKSKKLDHKSKVFRNLAVTNGAFLVEISRLLSKFRVEYDFLEGVESQLEFINNPNRFFNDDGWGSGGDKDPKPTYPKPHTPLVTV